MPSEAVIVNATFLQELARAHLALIRGIEALFREWTSKPSLSSLIPVHPRLSRLLHDSRPPKHVAGTLFPVFQIAETGSIGVCDLTTRMQLADIVNAAFAQKHLLQEVLEVSHARGILPYAPCISLLSDLNKRLNASGVNTIWVVHGDLPGPTFSTCDFLPGINIRSCHLDQLSYQSSQTNVLCCIRDDGTIETIAFCVLELHYHEFLALNDDVLDALKNLSDDRRTLPDLHTMLLAGDNRVLHALRTNSIAVEDEIKSLLEKVITPTVSASGFSQSVSLAPYSVVMRPCFSGQGGFVREADVGSDVFYRMIADLRHDDPRVVQPDVKPRMFDCSSSTDAISKSVIGAIAPTLDGRFYGSCMQTDENICNEASEMSCSTLPVVSCVAELASFDPSIFTFISKTDDLKKERVEILKALAFSGFSLVSSHHSKDLTVQSCLQDILHVGGNNQCSEKENVNASLREELVRHHCPSDDLIPQTVNSFDEEPPRFVAISSRSGCPESDGYLLSFANIGDAVERLDAAAIQTLRTLKVRWTSPSKHGHSNTEQVLAPVLLSPSRARLCQDQICAKNLSEKDQETFWTSFNLLIDQLRKDCERNKTFVNGPCVVLIDNHRFVHVCLDSFNNAVDVEKIPFQLEHRPEVIRALIAAHEHPLHQYLIKTYFPSAFANGKDVTSLQNWPVLRKNQLVSSLEATFKHLFFGKGANYWSPSGGSTGNGTGRVALPTALSEMHTMRSMLREMYLESTLIGSDTVCINLLVSANLSRSLEVQGEILVGASATHLPLGPDVPDEVVCNTIEFYGANMIVALGSRLVQLAIFCERTGRRLPSVTRLLHGGEDVSELATKSLQRYWNTDILCFAIFGSSEAGVFALRGPQESTYSVLPDGVHCEIVDENDTEVATGQFGTLVVTVLPRLIHPLVRYYTGDVARFTSSARNRFELKGRNMNSVSRKIGSATVLWSDVISAVQPILEEAFAGLCLYQLWLQEEDEHEHSVKTKTNVTLAVYGKDIEDWENLCSLVVRSLKKVFSPEHYVSNIDSVLLDNGDDLRRFVGSRKLQYFATLP